CTGPVLLGAPVEGYRVLRARRRVEDHGQPARDGTGERPSPPHRPPRPRRDHPGRVSPSRAEVAAAPGPPVRERPRACSGHEVVRSARRPGFRVGSHAWSAWETVVNESCAYCGEPATEPDHLTGRGPDGQYFDPSLVVPCCRACNLGGW